jgi:hypothetical protein
MILNGSELSSGWVTACAVSAVGVQPADGSHRTRSHKAHIKEPCWAALSLASAPWDWMVPFCSSRTLTFLWTTPRCADIAFIQSNAFACRRRLSISRRVRRYGGAWTEPATKDAPRPCAVGPGIGRWLKPLTALTSWAWRVQGRRSDAGWMGELALSSTIVLQTLERLTRNLGGANGTFDPC